MIANVFICSPFVLAFRVVGKNARTSRTGPLQRRSAQLVQSIPASSLQAGSAAGHSLSARHPIFTSQVSPIVQCISPIIERGSPHSRCPRLNGVYAFDSVALTAAPHEARGWKSEMPGDASADRRKSGHGRSHVANMPWPLRQTARLKPRLLPRFGRNLRISRRPPLH